MTERTQDRQPWKRRRALAAMLVVVCVMAAVAVLALSEREPEPVLTDEEQLIAAVESYDLSAGREFVEQIKAELGLESATSRDQSTIRSLCVRFAEHDRKQAIPLLIGVIDADNSPEMIYSVGHFALWPLTGVEYSAFHDGRWWRRWWAANRERFPEESRNAPIPDLKKTEYGRTYQPFPDDCDTLPGKLAMARTVLDQRLAARQGIREFPQIPLWQYADEVVRHDDPRAIPTLIALIAADRSAVLDVGRALKRITRVELRPEHDGDWWRQWWHDNKSSFAPEVQAIEIPDFQNTQGIPQAESKSTVTERPGDSSFPPERPD